MATQPKVPEPQPIKIVVGTSWTDTIGRTWTVYARKPFGVCCVRSGFRFGEMYDRAVRAELARSQVSA